MGIANIIPGVSGGTMAVSLGIYDNMIHALTHITKDWKSSLRFLLPIGVGAGIGIVGFSYLIELLLSKYTFPTALAFIGLILGGLPILFRSYQKALAEKGETIRPMHILVFLVLFAVVIAMSLMQEPSEALAPLSTSFGSLTALFFVGMLTSSTMVIPGISGSLTLMIIGYYYSLLHTLTGFVGALKAFNIDSLIHFSILILPFGLGFLVGIVLVSKLIDYLFSNYPSVTYSGILGLVLASPFAILFNTNALGKLSETNLILPILIGSVCALLCFFLTYTLGKKEDVTQ